MILMDNYVPTRITEVLKNAQWTVKSVIDIKKGDVFRQFEIDDKSPVLSIDGELIMYADKDALFDEKTGRNTVECFSLKAWIAYGNGETEIETSTNI